MTREEKIKTGYYNNHAYIVKHNGKASHCSNKKCQSKNPKRFEWALVKGKVCSKNIKDYIQLCPSCHRKYDETEERRKKLSKSSLNNSNANKPIYGIDQNGFVLYFDSVKQASESLKISRTGISNSLLKLSKTSGGYKWGYQTKKF